MTNREALIAAIRANPKEDTPKLAYADCIEDDGEPERAELIRIQVELARLRRREWELRNAGCVGIELELHSTHSFIGPPINTVATVYLDGVLNTASSLTFE